MFTLKAHHFIWMDSYNPLSSVTISGPVNFSGLKWGRSSNRACWSGSTGWTHDLWSHRCVLQALVAQHSNTSRQPITASGIHQRSRRELEIECGLVVVDTQHQTDTWQIKRVKSANCHENALRIRPETWAASKPVIHFPGKPSNHRKNLIDNVRAPSRKTVIACRR